MNYMHIVILKSQSLEDLLSNARRTGRVLTGDQSSAVGRLRHNNLLAPRLIGLDKFTSGDLVQLILDQVWHERGQLCLVFLDVGEGGNGGVGEQGLSGLGGRLDEHGRAVADGGDGLSGGSESLDQ